MKRWILFFCIAFILIAGTAFSADVVKYTIKKGDTLWDISGLKLTDPFAWPKIWKENPQIKNPDLIYPGQIIRIPKDLIQKQVVLPPQKRTNKEAVRMPVSEPVKQPKKVLSPDLILSAGYIEEQINKVGSIIATPSGMSMVGKDDEVYITVNGAVNEGQKFYTFKTYGIVNHPVTKQPLGELIEITGIIEVTGKEGNYIKALVIKSYSEIEVGSYLDNYYDVKPLDITREREGKAHGVIVAGKDLRYLTGRLDVVYLDRGVNDGLLPGDVLTVVSTDNPKRPIGKIRIISARNTTSVAEVIESTQEIVRGDSF